MEDVVYGEPFPLIKIVSGGQTGVDRAALDAAIFMELEHGGWCPQGRRAEDGRIDSIYQLRETPETDYKVRTEKNVIDSDATLICCRGELTGGTRLTERLTVKHRRPCLIVDFDSVSVDEGCFILVDWVRKHQIKVLNVAGPRESSIPGISRDTERFLVKALM